MIRFYPPPGQRRPLIRGRLRMGKEDELKAAIDLIYEAVLKEALWPLALIRVADAMGAGQVGLMSLDRRAGSYESIAPRTDPVMDASFKKYWAFHNPLWPRTLSRPRGEVFLLESLVSREQLEGTPFFHEWFEPAGFGFAAIGANLLLTDAGSTVFSIANKPGDDEICAEQKRIFENALQHVDRAVRIHRELRMRDLDQETAPERLEELPSGVMLVDEKARVLFANGWARALLDSRSGLSLHRGCLRTSDGSGKLEQLIASCGRKLQLPGGPGGEIVIRRSPSRTLRVTVTPLRARGTVAELPWLGLRFPVAMVTVRDPALHKWLM